MDQDGQPTQQIVPRRRRAEFITPIPKPKKRNGGAATGSSQQEIVFDEGKGISTREQQYGRWAFAEFTEVYQIQSDFENKVEGAFDGMIQSALTTAGAS